jgi:hypothetical protein
MSWLTNLFSGSVGGLVKEVGGIIDNLTCTGEEKQQFKLEMEKLLQLRDATLQRGLQAELQTKERIMVAELNQGDNFTKRARPTVVYMGLFFIFLNYCFIPIISNITGNALITPLDLPSYFWQAWGGIVATWCVGRTFEKRGAKSKVVEKITGAKSILE